MASASYTYDKVGNRLAKGGTVSESYRYDVIDQLLRSTSGAAIEIFSYDAVGNRLLGPSRAKDASYEHDAANRMLRGRQYLYSYDDNGNQVSKTLPGDSSKGWTYTWDYENRLVRAKRTGEGGARTVSFKYDPFGRRIEKSMTAVVNGLTKVVNWHYVYDESDIAMEVKNDGANTSVTSYDHGPGTDDHLAMEREGRFYYYHADGLGSVVSVTGIDHQPIQKYTYDSFGVLKPVVTFDNTHTYTGREWDKETGLYFYRARYYDPMEGRFVSKDPIGSEGSGVNLYGYVENNPANLTDPEGLDPTVPDTDNTNLILRCHVNPHNDRCENAIGGAIVGGALVCELLPAFIIKDLPHKGLGPHLHYGPKYPNSNHPKFHFGPKNPNFGKGPFTWTDWFKNGMPWRWK